MKVFIYAYEDQYQGLHGVSDQAVVEVNSIKEANEIGSEMAEGVIDSFGLWGEDTDEDEDIEEEFWDYGTEWEIHKIRDDISLSVEELDRLCSYEDHSDFVKMYCEKEELC